MSEIFLDYKNEVKKLIQDNYTFADILNKEFEYSTNELVANFQNVLPYKAVDDHLIYECLLELGFRPQETNVPLEYVWYFKRL